jgi:hypothetical protein
MYISVNNKTNLKNLYSFYLHYMGWIKLENYLTLPLKTPQRLKLKKQKSPAGIRQNLVWFGEIERKLAKLSMTTFAYRSSS